MRLFACHFDDMDLSLEVPTPEMRQRLYEYTLDPAEGTASMRRLTSVVGDFPVINPTRTGRPFRCGVDCCFPWCLMT